MLPESEKIQKTTNNQSTKFQQIQQMFGNFNNQVCLWISNIIQDKIQWDSAGFRDETKSYLNSLLILKAEIFSFLD